MKVSMLEGAPLYEQMQEDGQGCILSREDAHWVVRAAAGPLREHALRALLRLGLPRLRAAGVGRGRHHD